MTEEEKKAIDLLKFYEGFFKNIGHEEEVKSIESIINYIEKLQKENEELKKITTSYDAFPKYNKKNSIIIASPDFFQNGTFVKKFIPKDKIKNCINEYEKEIKTYEDKMVEITQKEKHFAIENEDYIRYSCIISNFTDKIKLLKNLIEEE